MYIHVLCTIIYTGEYLSTVQIFAPFYSRIGYTLSRSNIIFTNQGLQSALLKREGRRGVDRNPWLAEMVHHKLGGGENYVIYTNHILNHNACRTRCQPDLALYPSVSLFKQQISVIVVKQKVVFIICEMLFKISLLSHVSLELSFFFFFFTILILLSTQEKAQRVHMHPSLHLFSKNAVLW